MELDKEKQYLCLKEWLKYFKSVKTWKHHVIGK